MLADQQHNSRRYSSFVSTNIKVKITPFLRVYSFISTNLCIKYQSNVYCFERSTDISYGIVGHCLQLKDGEIPLTAFCNHTSKLASSFLTSSRRPFCKLRVYVSDSVIFWLFFITL